MQHVVQGRDLAIQLLEIERRPSLSLIARAKDWADNRLVLEPGDRVATATVALIDAVLAFDDACADIRGGTPQYFERLQQDVKEARYVLAEARYVLAEALGATE